MFAGLDYDAWAARPRVRGDRGRPAAGRRGAGRARAQGLEAARAAGARPGRAARGRRRPAPRPALVDRRGAGPPGPHPHRRPDRVLRAARRDQRALGGAPRAPGLALLAAATGRRRRTHPGFPPFDALLAAFGRLVARHPATTFVGAHVGCAAEDLGARRSDARREPELLTSTSRPGSASWAGSRTRAGPSSCATPTGSCSASDMAPDPDLYAIHYRFLETFDESFDYDTDDGARPGPLADPRDRPAGGRPAQGLPRQRPAGPPAGTVVTAAPDGPTGSGTRRGLDACASDAWHVHGPRPRPPPEPAQGTPAGRPGRGDVRGDGRVQAGGRPVSRPGRDRHAAGSRDRRGAVHRRRVAARRVRAHRRDRGDRLRGPLDGADQPGRSRAGASRRRSSSGASAAKLLVYYHPGASNAADQEGLVGQVAAACRAVDSRCSSSRSRSPSSTARS